MIKVSSHFIQQVNSRVIKNHVLTEQEINEILSKLDKISNNIPSGKKVYVRVKRFNYTIQCDDTSRGDTLIIVINSRPHEQHKCAITAVFAPFNTSGQYNANNCMSII